MTQKSIKVPMKNDTDIIMDPRYRLWSKKTIVLCDAIYSIFKSI